MRVTWLPAAQQTRLAQLTYYAERNPTAARNLGAELQRQIGRLKANPFVARPGRVHGTRELVIARTPFIAIYRVKQDEVEILRILHHAQKWP